MTFIKPYLKEELYEIICRDASVFTFIQDYGPDGLWLWDLKKPENLWMNPKFWDSLGYSSISTRPAWEKLIFPEDLKELQRELAGQQEEPATPYSFLLRFYHFSGYTIWMNCKLKLIEDESSGFTRALGALTDVTKFKKTDLGLIDQVQRYEHIIEGTNIGAWEWNIQTGETIFNKQWANILGYELDEIRPTSPETWDRFSHPEDKIKCDHLLTEHLEGLTEFYETECRMKHRSGKWIWVADRGKVVSWTPDGKPEWMTGYHEEITERKNNFERNKLFIDQAPTAIAMFDTQMRYLAVSNRWLMESNITEKEIIGKSHYEINPDLPEKWKEIHRKSLKGKVFRKDEDYFKRADGSELWVNWEVRPWYKDENEIGGLIMHIADVSNLKKAEKLNRERQNFLETILSNINVGIVSCDETGRLTLFNETLREWHGLPETDIPQSQFSEYYGLYKTDGVTRLKTDEIPLIKALHSGYVHNDEMVIKPNKGDIRITTVTGSQLRDDSGKISGAVVALHDITERKKAEERLRISEAAFRGNFENAAIGMAILNEKGQWLEVNKSLCQMTGYSAKELKKLTFQDITHPEDLDADVGLLEELLRGKRNYYHMEKRYFHKDGHLIYVILSVSLVKDANHQPLYFISQITDVTPRKKAEQKLEETLAKLESILDAGTQVSIIATDKEGTINAFNKGAENLLGYSAEEVLHKTKPVQFHRESEVRKVAKALSKETGKHVEDFKVFSNLAERYRHDTREWTYIRKDGSSFPVQLTINPIKDKNEIVGYLGIAVDISRLKAVETEIKSLLTVTKDQNERLKNFAHIVSHNLRSHSGNLAMLLDLYVQENPEAEKDEMIIHLKTASQNLKETIAHLNEVVLMNTSVSDNLVNIDLKDSIDHTVKNVSALAEASGVTIQNNVKENVFILGLPAYLDSILLNFLTNGIKYSCPERKSYVKLSTENTGKHIILKIEDNGLGIDLSKNRRKLFGMYKTFHTHKDSRGIGLFITKNQIEAIGGKIEVESEKGTGTTFKIYFKYVKN
ncbi:PAS domain S-box protein [Salegentibacter chungangensis]|uniref:histidine kinase n=1 Tax=Salegentibacter chungangensis TaxID=1335724 RepID=A0ABW3NUG8_9FLAO